MTEIFHNLMRNLVMLINARIALGNVNNFEKIRFLHSNRISFESFPQYLDTSISSGSFIEQNGNFIFKYVFENSQDSY